MEVLFVSWMFSCFIGGAGIYLYVFYFSKDYEAAVKMFNHVVITATIGGIIGSIFSVGLYLVLLIPDALGFLDIDALTEYIGKMGLSVILFSNIAVMSAYVATTRGIET